MIKKNFIDPFVLDRKLIKIEIKNSPSPLYNEYFSIFNNLITFRPKNDYLLFSDFDLPYLNKVLFNTNLNQSSPEPIFLENLAFLNIYQNNTIFNNFF